MPSRSLGKIVSQQDPQVGNEMWLQHVLEVLFNAFGDHTGIAFPSDTPRDHFSIVRKKPNYYHK